MVRPNALSRSQRTTGWAKLNGANAVSFVVVKHVLENRDNFLAGENREISVYLRTLRSINIKFKCFLPEGATVANDFLCSSILAVLLTHNFYIKTILLTTSMVKKSSVFARIYLLASIMYYNLFLGQGE